MSFTTTSFTINYVPHIVGNWIVPELQTDFQDPLENMMMQYIFDQWTLTTPTELSKPADMKTQNAFIQFKVGFFDTHRPYEVAAVRTTTKTEEVQEYGRRLQLSTGIDIGTRMHDINRDKVNPALDKMEKEVMRIVGQYITNEIIGIKYIIYEGNDPVLTGTDNAFKSDWRSITHVRMFYEKLNIL